MSEVFDPEKVEQYQDRAGHNCVRASEFLKLLALYREAVGEHAECPMVGVPRPCPGCGRPIAARHVA